MGDAWEWDLADGNKISARLELPMRIESVYLGPRLVSRSGAGGKENGHHIVALPTPLVQPKPGEVYRAAPAAREAEVTFDPTTSLCSLRIDGAIIPPTREPDPASMMAPGSARHSAAVIAALASNPRRVLGMAPVRLGLIAVGAFVLLGIGAGPSIVSGIQNRRARNKVAAAPAVRTRTEVLSAPDHSIAAHYPSDFESTVDEKGAVISLHRPQKLEMIVLISMIRSDLDDPRDLDKIMMQDLAKFATKSDATLSTTITTTGDCQGFPGAISTQTLSHPDKAGDVPQKIVGCSMLRNGRGYFFAYFVPEFLADVEEPELRKIVDATDIYDLPPPSVAQAFPQANGAYNNNNNDDDPNDNRNNPTVRFSQQGAFAQQGAFPPNWRGTAAPGSTGPRPNPNFRPAPQRSWSVAHANGPPTPAPASTLQFNANGSVEYAGPAKGTPNAGSQANRQKVPW